MSDILSTVGTRQKASTPVPQSKPRTRNQVKNAAGGYTYQVGDEARLHRFLTLGTDGSTYYTTARELTEQNAAALFRMVDTKGVYTVEQIAQISEAGRAPKNKQAIFALAVAAAKGDQATKIAAYAALPRVVRTGTHLFEFINYSMQFRGWGMGLRKAVARWYTERDVDRLAYQVLKYRQREGITHFDLLRQSHLTTYASVTPEQAGLFNWICAKSSAKNEKSPRHNRGTLVDRYGEVIHTTLPKLVDAFEELQWGDITVKDVVRLIDSGVGVSWEMIPDKFINESVVWESLLAQGIPQTALMRQLPRLTRIGLTTGATGKALVAQLVDAERLKKARVHPINVLIAQKTYAQGHSERGSSTWTVDRKIADALDQAFYAAFGAVEPAGVRTLEALDVSGSMGSSVSGIPGLSCREASGALAMITMATEPDADVVGFTSSRGGGYYYGYGRNAPTLNDVGDGLSRLDISPRRRLDDNIRAITGLPFGGTDCSLPIVWATKHNEQFGAFRIYTDNETWAGNIHVDQALEKYRQRTGIDARLEVISMTATGNSVCNPEDPRQLDVSGFDSTVPQLIADHAGGRL